MKLKLASERILEIEPYKGGAYAKVEGKKLIKLSSNENPFGCSTKVIMAVNKELNNLHRYPDGNSNLIRKKIGEVNKLNPEQIICSAGSDELITFICMAFGGAEREVLYTKHGFLMYPITARSVGCKPIAIEEKNLKADVDAILNAVNEKTAIVFLANPNNPTGSYLNEKELTRLVKGMPKHVLLALDLAYYEYAFALASDYPNPVKLVDEFENVIMIRTFSKTYGIPGLRLGWGYSNPQIIDILNRVRGPFNISSLAQIGGVAALEDAEFVEKSVNHNTKWLHVVSEAISDMGLKVYPSVANFVLVDFGTEKMVGKVDSALQAEGISARRMAAYHLPTCIRFTIGLEDENKLLLDVLRKAINY